MNRSALLMICCMQVAGAAYQAFVANMAQLGSSGVTGEVAIFVTPSGLLGVGSSTGLEASIIAGPSQDCTATNGCGVHVHSGTACTDAAAQGGHYFAAGEADPWASVGYRSTTSAGATTFSFVVSTTATDIANKPFIVHNNAGGRVACGILTEIVGVRVANLAPLGSSGATGEVVVVTIKDKIIGAGRASGLEPNLKSESGGGADCAANNGCGVHVHSGTSCDSTTTQGGHFFKGTLDPWATVRYGSTDSSGNADFVFAVSDSATDITNKPFIVHNNAGGRVACGLLYDRPSRVFTAEMSPLVESNGRSDIEGPRGRVTIAIIPTGLVGFGTAQGLEASLRAPPFGASCGAKNGCGAHVHSGTACTNATTQGGHYFAAGMPDPWASVGYSFTTRTGRAFFKFSLQTAAQDIENKPFILHNDAGRRVACGLLTPVLPGATTEDDEDDEREERGERSEKRGERSTHRGERSTERGDGRQEREERRQEREERRQEREERREEREERKYERGQGHDGQGGTRRLDATTRLLLV